MGWNWLEKHSHSWGMLTRVVIKVALLFVLLNALFALTNPLSAIGRLSVYNALVAGRDRLPYGEDPASYNLSLDNLSALFASHRIDARADRDAFRVLVMGDSSVWGFLLRPEETLTGQINAMGLEINGREVVAYNIGHPLLSVTKDLLLLDYALRYEPDMIVWAVTLDALNIDDQLRPPIVQNNADRARALIAEYGLNLDADSLPPSPDFMGQTIIGQRRELADWVRLQAFGFSWQATGIDQVYGDFTPTANDLSDSAAWGSLDSPDDTLDASLALDVISAAHALAGDVPIILINEPIFIADGANSDVRYNAWYPRWAYDAYRLILADAAEASGWRYFDLWDAIPAVEFTDSPVHLTPDGSRLLAEQVAELLQ